MPKIVEYTAPEKRILPSEAGYQAAEMAGRRVGPIYREIAQDIKEGGKIQAAVNEQRRWPFDILELEQRAQSGGGVRIIGDRNLRAHNEINAGGAALGHMLNGLIRGSNRPTTIDPGRLMLEQERQQAYEQRQQDRLDKINQGIWKSNEAAQQQLVDENSPDAAWGVDARGRPVSAPDATWGSDPNASNIGTDKMGNPIWLSDIIDKKTGQSIVPSTIPDDQGNPIPNPAGYITGSPYQSPSQPETSSAISEGLSSIYNWIGNNSGANPGDTTDVTGGAVP